MKKKISAILAMCMLAAVMTGCSGSKTTEEPAPAETTAAEAATAAET